MHCRKVKEELARYLAGECRSYERVKIEQHLAGCAACAAELQELKLLDRLLDQWETAPAPDDLYGSIMNSVAETGETQRRGGASRISKGRVQALAPVTVSVPVNPRGRLGPLLRDLAVAAAVTMVMLWNAGSWLTGEGPMVAAGKSVNDKVAAYTQVTDSALDRFTTTTGEYTRKILFEEWNQNEMR